MTRKACCGLPLIFVLACATAPMHAAVPHAAAASGAALWADADEHSQLAFDRPQQVLQALDRHLLVTPVGTADWRVLVRSRGTVAAAGNRPAEAESAALALARSGPLGQADAALVRAAMADVVGASPLAIEAAEDAIARYAQACPASPGECDPRGAWMAQPANPGAIL